ncbi:MAG: site-2 protease family protein [Actinomycetota bacterium]
MPSPPAFRVFGFPVQVRSGFLILMVLIVLVNPGSLGIWLAVFIAGFTLLHELGHAFAARATGAEAEIALDFMAGYAAFVPTRTLSRWERAGISFAGPAIQITVGIIAYALVNKGWGWPRATDDVAIAILWAGPTIGLFNLIPILPFDGGTILEQAVSRFAPERARSIMIGITVTIVFSAITYAMLRPALRPYIIFMVMPLLSVAQMSTARKATAARTDAQAIVARAEALAWATNDVSRFPPGNVPSPWFRSHQQLTQGHADVARDLLLADLASAEPVNWWPPDAASHADLAALLGLLPRPLPAGRPFSSFVLSGVLLRLSEFEVAASYAAQAYANGRAPMLAVHVARAAAALGDRVTAIGWLRAAAGHAPMDAVRAAVAAAPEFEPLRHDPELAGALGLS